MPPGAIVGVVAINLVVLVVGFIGLITPSSTSEASDYTYTPTYSYTYTPSYTLNSATEDTDSYTAETETETSYEDEYTTEDEVAAQPQPVVALEDNPINMPGTGAVTTSCEIPQFNTDAASQERFYQAVLPCLMEAWTPVLEAAGLPVEPPTVITSGENVTSPCGPRQWNQTAMYCPANHTIYMTARYYAEVEKRTHPGVYLGQFAHEFGHALQGMVGISQGYSNALYDVGGFDTEEGLELSRRIELQATCFEGMTLAALQNGGVSNDYIFTALEDSSNRGDAYGNQRDHGTPESNRMWVEQGFYKNQVSECNTWAIDSSYVQ